MPVTRYSQLAIAMVVQLCAIAHPANALDHQQICEAIARGQMLRLYYRPSESERLIEPRFLYYTKYRDVILNGWQISGFSESGNLPGSRSFRLDRAQKIEIAEEKPNATVASSSRLPSGAAELICRK